MYHLFEIYPEFKGSEDRTLYYIEFLQFFADNPITWKIYKRQFFHSAEEMAKVKKERPEDYLSMQLSNEGHPWWLLDGTLQPDGTVPDKAYLKWMVDAFNEKAEKELTSPAT